MTHPFGHPEFFGQGFEGMTAFQITPSSGIKRVFVVTFDGGPHPRMVRREERFDDPTTMYSLPEPQRETERAYLSAIPRNLSRPTQNTSSETLEKDTFCVRPIQGTLVQDASGKFFEAIGQQLRSEEHTSELQSRRDLVCRLLLEKKKKLLVSICLLVQKSKIM